MSSINPKPITWTDHPSCIQVLDEVIDQVDMIGAFRHAAKTLRPDNFDRRGILWVPKPNHVLDTEISLRAALGSKAYFNDMARFHRPEIFAELKKPEYECVIIPEKSWIGRGDGPDSDRSDFVQLSSTSYDDFAFTVAGGPHIDGPPVGTDTVPHRIRALHYNHASDPNNVGSILYSAMVHEHDIDDIGNILKPDPFLDRPGTSKLGPAWQNTVRGAVFFMNVGGPVECQMAHDSRANLVDQHGQIEKITRHLDRYDFATRQQP